MGMWQCSFALNEALATTLGPGPQGGDRQCSIRVRHAACRRPTPLSDREHLAASQGRLDPHLWSSSYAVTKQVLEDVGPLALMRELRLATGLGRTRRGRQTSPAPAGRRPTAESNASTAPCSTNGPTSAPTPATPNAPQPWQTSGTPTTTTAATPRSEASHPSPRQQPCGSIHILMH